MTEAALSPQTHSAAVLDLGVRENYRRPRYDDACVSEECAASVFGIHFLEKSNLTCDFLWQIITN